MKRCGFVFFVFLLLGSGSISQLRADDRGEVFTYYDQQPDGSIEVTGLVRLYLSYTASFYYEVELFAELIQWDPYVNLDHYSIHTDQSVEHVFHTEGEPGQTYFTVADYTAQVYYWEYEYFYDYCDWLRYYYVPEVGESRDWTCEIAGWILLGAFAIARLEADVSVQPGVEVTGTRELPLRASGTSSGANQLTLTATCDPDRCNYQWSSQSNKISLSGANQATVTVTSVDASSSRGDIPIKVRCTDTQTGLYTDWETTLTVLKPTSLVLNTDTTNPSGHTCNPNNQNPSCSESGFQGGGVYSSYLRTRTYKVMDQFSPAAQIAGFNMLIDESYSSPSGQCAGPAPNIGSGLGYLVTDCFYFCSEACRTGGQCSPSSTQTIKVNGFTVATNSVTWTCSGATVQ